MTEAEARHYRQKRWRTLSEFLVLGTILGLCTWAARGDIVSVRSPMLSQDLEDTPKGFICMQSLVGAAVNFPIGGFHGPFYATEPDGTKNPRIAEYGVVAEGETKSVGVIRFFTPPPHRWRYFSYGNFPNQKTGVYAPKMVQFGEYHDENGAVTRLDYQPCAKFLGRGN